MRLCSVPECDKPAGEGYRTYCDMHRARLRKHGSLDLPVKPSDREKFDARWTADASGCWVWTGSALANGYGRITLAGRSWLAHRWSFVHFRGPIPDGFQVDHLCRVPLCVNPDHLEAVTPRENVLRENHANRRGAAASHCPHGHPYEGPNLIIGTHGGRLCRECHRRSDRKRRERRAS